MRMIQPQPFTFEAGPRAILLLHAFTGHSADVRMLGRYLEKKGYTSYAPIYRGHGLPPEELLKVGPDEWWEDAQEGLQHLQDLGYNEIAVAGLSIGGLLSLKLAYSHHIKAVIPMSTPVHFDNKKKLLTAFQSSAIQYKQLEGKEKETINREITELMKNAPKTIDQLSPLIHEVKGNLGKINIPTFIIQPKKDQLINPESATHIYNHIEAENKLLTWYEHSTHVITMDKEKDQVHQDIYQFLESLQWKE